MAQVLQGIDLSGLDVGSLVVARAGNNHGLVGVRNTGPAPVARAPKAKKKSPTADETRRKRAVTILSGGDSFGILKCKLLEYFTPQEYIEYMSETEQMLLGAISNQIPQ